MTTRAAKIKGLAVLETMAARDGQMREVVGNRVCKDCEQPAKIIRGKAKLYTVGCGCGMKPANGNAWQDILLAACLPAPEPEPVPEPEPAPEPSPEPEKTPEPAAPVRGFWAGFWEWFMGIQVLPGA